MEAEQIVQLLSALYSTDNGARRLRRQRKRLILLIAAGICWCAGFIYLVIALHTGLELIVSPLQTQLILAAALLLTGITFLGVASLSREQEQRPNSIPLIEQIHPLLAGLDDDSVKQLETYIREHPVASIAIAAGCGALLSKAMRP